MKQPINLVARGEYPWSLRRRCDGVFAVRRDRAVCGDHCPFVVKNLRIRLPTQDEHRLDGENGPVPVSYTHLTLPTTERV